MGSHRRGKVRVGGSSTSPHPVIYFAGLDLPETPDFIGAGTTFSAIQAQTVSLVIPRRAAM